MSQQSTDPARLEAALLRWRLILGPDQSRTASTVLAASENSLRQDARLARVDRALDFLYGSSEQRGAGLGGSSPYLPTWLGDIRRYFPVETVAFMEKEAIERKGLRQLLLEPETLATLQKDVLLAATIIGLKSLMPEETRRTALQVVAEIVEELRQRIELQVRQAVLGALRRTHHAPLKVARNLDVRRTVRDGLRHYEPSLSKIIPDRIHFFANQRRYHEWRMIVLVDQSGSMGESIVYSAVFAAVFASLPSLDTRLIFFDSNVADVSDRLTDPVELLFSIQLGGGTDIARAVAYARDLVEQPDRTMVILISDLHEGGDRTALLRRLSALHEDRARVLCVLALNDKGVASYNHALARDIASLSIPAFAATPNRLVAAVEQALRGDAFDAAEFQS